MATGAIAAHDGLPHAIGIDHYGSLGIAPLRTGRDGFSRGLAGKFGGNAVNGEEALGVGLIGEKGSGKSEEYGQLMWGTALPPGLAVGWR